MQKKTSKVLQTLSPLIAFALIYSCNGGNGQNKDGIAPAVDNAIKPVMQKYNIAGMAVGVTINGKRYYYNYGVASKTTQQAVTDETLFEIGSITKTFNATLAAYAQIGGYISLTDSVSKYLQSLRGSSFDGIQLVNLGTYTAGGLPLQLPEEIKDTFQLMNYYKQWHPDYHVGSYRVYSNTSIGLLGVITAHSMHQPFVDLIENKLFPQLGITNSYINIPPNKMYEYAQGYNEKDTPVRVKPAVLSSETYGVKSCTKDLLQFLEANMGVAKLNGQLQQAITNTHTGYFKAGALTQDLVWEQYSYPTDINALLAGNSDAMIFAANPAIKISPALPPQQNVLIDKTGSTNGFGSYVLFVPSKKIGIVVLANKSYPIASRVRIAYQILARLEKNDL